MKSLYALLLVWVLLVGKDEEPLKPPVPKFVLWQHTRHGLADNLSPYHQRVVSRTSLEANTHLFWLLLHHLAVLCHLESTGVHAMSVVHLLVGLVARDNDALGICHDDVVARIDGRVVDSTGLVLAHEHRGNVDGELSKHTIPCRDMVPGPRERKRRLSGYFPRSAFSPFLYEVSRSETRLIARNLHCQSFATWLGLIDRDKETTRGSEKVDRVDIEK